MKTYPAKLLLFGEHTVNIGSQALAVPLPLFSARWQYAPQLSRHELTQRQMQLPQFAAYLERLQQRNELMVELDVAAFQEALHQGLIFESNIPTGYGAGSSGALVAAVFGEWGKDSSDWIAGLHHVSPKKILWLKTALAQLESFFHGTSSGTDPLICFLQQPVLLGGHEGVKIVNFHYKHEGEFSRGEAKYQLFLLDTGIERKATPLIEYFLEKMREQTFFSHCNKELLPAVQSAIQAFLSGEQAKLFDAMHLIGEFQLLFLEKMIPPAFISIWREGLEGGLFKLKLCGAGGGGFMLGMTTDFEKIKECYPSLRLIGV